MPRSFATRRRPRAADQTIGSTGATRWSAHGTTAGLLLASALAVAGALGALPGPLRAATALGFLAVCPGLAGVRLLRIEEPVARWTLAVALSFALATLGSLVTVYAGVWSPPALMIGLAAWTVAAALVPSALRVGSAMEPAAAAGAGAAAEPPVTARVPPGPVPDATAPGAVLPLVLEPPADRTPMIAEAPLWILALVEYLDPYLAKPGQEHRLPAGTRCVAAGVTITNGSAAPMAFDPADIRFRETNGTEYPPQLAFGTGPRLTAQNLAGGEHARGWVWFLVPAAAEVAEIRYYGPRPVLRIPLQEPAVKLVALPGRLPDAETQVPSG